MNYFVFKNTKTMYMHCDECKKRYNLIVSRLKSNRSRTFTCISFTLDMLPNIFKKRFKYIGKMHTAPCLHTVYIDDSIYKLVL